MLSNEEFCKILYRTNTHFREGVFSVLGIYKGKRKRILIKDECGEMEPLAESLIKGQKPGILVSINKEEYLSNQFRKIHGDKYDYSNIIYKGAHEKVCVSCHKHGEFYITPSSHLQGSGCVCCSRKINRNYFDYGYTEPQGELTYLYQKKILHLFADEGTIERRKERVQQIDSIYNEA